MKKSAMPLRIGHRGAAGHARENTKRSILRALDLGVDLIEIDLRHTADGAIVLCHDAWIGRHQVRESTLAELRAIDDEMTTLEDLLEITNGRCGLMLELKVADLAEQTMTAVAGFTGPLIYASFHHDELLAIRRLQPDAETLALIHAAPVDKARFAIDAQATHAGIQIEFANAEFVAELWKSGLKVFVYTVNEPEDIAEMKGLRVEGIISDFPDRV